MDKHRRRSAGRPAGPPAAGSEPVPAAEPAETPVGDPDGSAESTDGDGPARHRRRQRPIRPSIGDTAAERPQGKHRSGRDADSTASPSTVGSLEAQRSGRADSATPGADRRSAGAGSTRGGQTGLDPIRTAGMMASTGVTAGSGMTPMREERRRGETAMERSLRALVTLRTTQLPPTVAMRAREVAAPSAADLAAAERELVIVRRYYVPPAPLAAGKTPEQHPPAGRTEQRTGRPAENRRSARRLPRGQ